jgi:hypothetical protein
LRINGLQQMTFDKLRPNGVFLQTSILLYAGSMRLSGQKWLKNRMKSA